MTYVQKVMSFLLVFQGTDLSLRDKLRESIMLPRCLPGEFGFFTYPSWRRSVGRPKTPWRDPQLRWERPRVPLEETGCLSHVCQNEGRDHKMVHGAFSFGLFVGSFR